MIMMTVIITNILGAFSVPSTVPCAIPVSSHSILTATLKRMSTNIALFYR